MADPQNSRFSTLGLFAAALAGGFIAYFIGAPMPFMIGGVIGAALFIFWLENAGHVLRKPPKPLRMAAIAGVGGMIGTTVTPDLLTILPYFWITGLAILPFVVIAHAGNFMILWKLGRYPVADAYFAGMPGGLIEAILLGEKAGADVRLLTIQHFIRVLTVVLTVPLLFLIFTGEVVGSATGQGLSTGAFGLLDIAVLVAIASIGAILGHYLRMPAGAMLGPLIVGVILSVGGVVEIHTPAWLLNIAQFVIGATLGAQFSGIDGAMLRQSLFMGLVSVAYMLTVGFIFAIGFAPLVPVEVPAMFISFAAGGLTEMSLIALSLQLSPVIVAAHHLIRIILTVWVGSQIFRRFVESRI